MKKIIVAVTLLATGCSPNYCNPDSPNYDPARCSAFYKGLSAGFNGASQGLNNAYQMDYQLQQQNPPQIVYPNRVNPYNPNTNTNYWQEQRARQEYYKSLQPGLYSTE